MFLSVVSTFLVAGGARAKQSASNAFALTSVSLYLPEQAMRLRGPSSGALAGYIKALVARADAIATGAPASPGVSGAVVVALKPPARSRIWIMAGDASREGELTSLLKAPLEAVPPPSVTGVNAFAIAFSAWGGGKSPPMSFMPVPEEWRHALGRGGMLPDDALRVVWPD